ncbi:MAG: sulfurtransferase TusA family protein [Alphaproteobacteria bacterium]|nr:sulfurtransferase TusA family protein [Alphaproteobacteria bacterium]
MVAAHKSLDVKGLNSPLPVLKAKKAMMEIPAGGTLEVLATDPRAVTDFELFCKSTGATLVEHDCSAGVYRFVVKNTG